MHDKEIYLLRHGDTGLKHQYVGSSDVSLSPKGTKEVIKSCGFLSAIDFDTVLCSPMKRCVETVAHLSCSCTIQFHDSLREIDFGRWEKKKFEEIVLTDKAEVDAWVASPDSFTFPEGESLEHFGQRITSIANHLHGLQGRVILVVCHGGIIRHLLCNLLKVPKEQYLLFEIQSGSFAQIRLHKEGGVLTGLNHRG
ncbi:MAG: alpha-ribazole phosphatase [Desulforhopalus sp.]|jgi:alpha-ribazole phosphatase